MTRTIFIIFGLSLFLLWPLAAAAQLKPASVFVEPYNQAAEQAKEHARLGQYQEALALLEGFRLKHISEPNAKYLVKRAQKGAVHYRKMVKLWEAARKSPKTKLDALASYMLRRPPTLEFAWHADESFRLLDLAKDKSAKVQRILGDIFPAMLVINIPKGDPGGLESELRTAIEALSRDKGVLVRATDGKWLFTLDLKFSSKKVKEQHQVRLAARCRLKAHAKTHRFGWTLSGLARADTEDAARKQAVQAFAQEFTQRAAMHVLYMFRHF